MNSLTLDTWLCQVSSYTLRNGTIQGINKVKTLKLYDQQAIKTVAEYCDPSFTAGLSF